MSTIDTFWSGSIDPSASSLPKALLRQQAASLGSITKNIVEANIASTVETDEADGFIDPPKIIHSFEIVAPLLGFQKFILFNVEQLVGVEYPLIIHSNYVKGSSNLRCNNIQEFNANLKSLLSSPDTATLINSIIAQSA